MYKRCPRPTRPIPSMPTGAELVEGKRKDNIRVWQNNFPLPPINDVVFENKEKLRITGYTLNESGRQIVLYVGKGSNIGACLPEVWEAKKPTT